MALRGFFGKINLEFLRTDINDMKMEIRGP
jgi:hypothetical protein